MAMSPAVDRSRPVRAISNSVETKIQAITIQLQQVIPNIQFINLKIKIVSTQMVQNLLKSKCLA